ncbi:hypothetical protein ACFYE2_05015 [Kocuria sp. CPCC 205300]|uniref:hypothetical protein n=1 Tax=Kocuria sabuli TaxID=3071448 RepID=UPI0036D92B74
MTQHVNSHGIPNEQHIHITADPPKHQLLISIFVPLLVAVLGSYGVAIWTGDQQERNARTEFMTTERAVVYAEYLEAAVRYQNEINEYMTIIPRDDPIRMPRQMIHDESSRLAFGEVMAARENYVNKRTRARLLQGPDANAPMQEIDNLLFSASDDMEVNKTKNLRGETDGLTNLEIIAIADAKFNASLNEKRGAYVEAVRPDFHGDV